MVTTYIAFMEEDTLAVLEALDIRNYPRVWHLGDLAVLSRSGPAALKIEALHAAGISFNYTGYNTKTAKIPAVQGVIRYGHDGTVMSANLLADRDLMGMYTAELHRRSRLDDEEVSRVAHVCSAMNSWDNRTEHGQMRRMRLLLS